MMASGNVIEMYLYHNMMLQIWPCSVHVIFVVVYLKNRKGWVMGTPVWKKSILHRVLTNHFKTVCISLVL